MKKLKNTCSLSKIKKYVSIILEDGNMRTQEQIKTLKVQRNMDNLTEFILVANEIPYFKGYGLSKEEVEKQVLLEYYQGGFAGGNNKYRKIVDLVKSTENGVNKGYTKITNKLSRAIKKTLELSKEFKKVYGRCLTRKDDYKNYNYMMKRSKELLRESEDYLKQTLYLSLKQSIPLKEERYILRTKKQDGYVVKLNKLSFLWSYDRSKAKKFLGSAELYNKKRNKLFRAEKV